MRRDVLFGKEKDIPGGGGKEREGGRKESKGLANKSYATAEHMHMHACNTGTLIYYYSFCHALGIASSLSGQLIGQLLRLSMPHTHTHNCRQQTVQLDNNFKLSRYQPTRFSRFSRLQSNRTWDKFYQRSSFALF